MDLLVMLLNQSIAELVFSHWFEFVAFLTAVFILSRMDLLITPMLFLAGLYVNVYRRANAIYIPKSCNLQHIESLSLSLMVISKI